ncbi:type I methionyl aminopeptidase [Spirochaeta cellobiosiphila]|uniref:type I methionyl aminopeptidase n=1 Tax=Spirochaeta cellobiosiphila TaxID=504483 RepID=UPI00040F88AE|nr:type I methionyl aminopeptidase [Spirochaeta cellobiosiphila]
MISIKNDEQIKGIRKSCQLLASLYEVIPSRVKPGVTTKELDSFAYDFISKHKGIPAFLGYQGFPGTLCTSVNDEVIHGIPGNRRLKEGDIISIDCGINLDGYISDSAITLAVGQISDQHKKLLEITEKSLYLGIEQALNKNRVKDISRAVEAIARENNLGIVHQYCGHGVGLEVHEDPQIPNYVGRGPNPRLRPGMVLAIEPMLNIGTGDVEVLDDDWTVVTLDEKASAHFEHTVLITENGPEILTKLG